MTGIYARHHYTPEDEEQADIRARRQPQPWDEIVLDHRAEAADLRNEIATLEENAAELSAEIGAMALRRDPALPRWLAMAETADRDLAAARVRLGEIETELALKETTQ